MKEIMEMKNMKLLVVREEKGDSPDMFESEPEEMDIDQEPTRVEKEELIQKYASNLDKTLLENEESLPDFVTNSHIFKKKKEEFITDYVDNLFHTEGSQKIAESYSQLPTFVTGHEYVDKKLKSKTKQQLSSWRILKNINETLRELKKNPSDEAYSQQVIITASAMCSRYGDPGLEDTRRVLEEARAVKKNLFTDNQSDLRPPARKKREIFPAKVVDIAVEC